ncbi:N-acetylmuramoyl-L-alanine amidase, partial [Proteus mirabilis]|uniref:N-acetylmuramoyl-L-alanine amidase n=1 Tax=Proteus mirabilis TaxID=584 RepID=UPI001954E3BD
DMMRSRYAALVLLSFSLVLLSSFTLSNGKPYQKQVLKRIVIDPGHGGHDNGARGRYSNEKDIALAVSLKLEQV